MGVRIHQLTPSVANQIAAGEVIERPASVVKELLENALDAGATQVSIEIGFGGLNQIKVSDNGMGIVSDDLPLAVAAHATSKIKHLNDLYVVSSMGFRGEALASIASVSRLSLQSKPASQEHAMMLEAEQGVFRLLPCARAQGTTVDVRDLFFNTPVRKRFLKTERIEYQAIETVVKRFALSEPMLALTLKHNDKQTLLLPAAVCEQTKLVRVKKILGKTFIDQAVYIDVERAGMRLQGFISQETYQRSQSDKQWMYINRRMVKDKLLSHAIKQAYENVLHPGRYPTCLLYLTIPAGEVDVNVHPTKHEVRFAQPRLVHDFITSQLVQALTPENKTYSFESTSALNTVNEKCAHPLLISVSREQESEVTFTILNTQFAIAVIGSNQSYLIDIALLQEHQLRAMLNEQTYPLLSRPLLVPVIFTIDKAHYDLIEQHQPVLAELGIQLDFTSEYTFTIRTITQCLPLINLNQLLQRIHTVAANRSDLLALLVDCHSFNAHQLTSQDKIELAQYFQRQLPFLSQNCSPRHLECNERSPDSSIDPGLEDPSPQAPRDDVRAATLSQLKRFSVCLDIKRCRDLVHG